MGNRTDTDDETVVFEVVNQRSIQIESLSATRPVNEKTRIDGDFFITNQSGQPGLQVVIQSLELLFQEKSGKTWVTVPSTSYACTFWADHNKNGVRDANELVTDLDPNKAGLQTAIVFTQDIRILYTCTKTTSWADNVRITSLVTIGQRLDPNGAPTVFRYTGTFTFPRR